MNVRCIGCDAELGPGDRACHACSRVRDLPKRLQKGVPVRARVLVMRSRSKGNPHVLDVAADRRVACTSCLAAQHGRRCWASGSIQRRLDRRKDKDLPELLDTIEKVYHVLAEHPEARDSDIECVRWYFREWHQVPDTITWDGILDLQRREYGCLIIDRVVRVRAHIQNRLDYFPPCDEVLVERGLKERTTHGFFSPVEGGADA